MASAGGAVLMGQTPSPAQGTPNLTGQWVLETPPARTPPDRQVLTIQASEELTISQNATSITVEHSVNPGSHPRAGVHPFGSRGSVSGAGNAARSDVFWFGRELIITASTETTGTDGARNAASSSEKWSLEVDGRLVIRVVEERSGAEAVRATLVYRRR